jgi:hypothetical protein
MSVKVVLILSCVLSFAVQRGISLWLLLEINFVSFVGLLGARKSSCEKTRALNYFLVQALGRRLMLVSLVFLIGGGEFFIQAVIFFFFFTKIRGGPPSQLVLKAGPKIVLTFYLDFVLLTKVSAPVINFQGQFNLLTPGQTFFSGSR